MRLRTQLNFKTRVIYLFVSYPISFFLIKLSFEVFLDTIGVWTVLLLWVKGSFLGPWIELLGYLAMIQSLILTVPNWIVIHAVRSARKHGIGQRFWILPRITTGWVYHWTIYVSVTLNMVLLCKIWSWLFWVFVSDTLLLIWRLNIAVLNLIVWALYGIEPIMWVGLCELLLLMIFAHYLNLLCLILLTVTIVTSVNFSMTCFWHLYYI